ncbi:hypothetical protein BD324DRAFT_618077 [Kockovaella imperatae]|uniref:Methyltransferase n=1 Tax=Kockovaella imperatae TaxID=4999 RepID=A0A1Y1UND9_9TREE|nr:hypothetical protein BD324DRAFT_618077 [Kockovaella imperatae]ORX38976.1 hypothetical protein BD324DRAFT_618077 [Kockovaella imperatae]
MPSISSPSQLTAVIGFNLPDERLDHDPSVYLTYLEGREKPVEHIRVPVLDLRPELEAEQQVHPQQQLYERGYAVTKHQSPFVERVASPEGIEGYLAESAELLRSYIGCTRVIAWNSVIRRNAEGVKLKPIEKQKGPEKGFKPTDPSRIQPIAGVAHVDQDATWGKELVGKAAGRPADSFQRGMIVNLWRPLNGPVTNAPLAMADGRTFTFKDISRHASQYGIGIDIHHSPSQHWSYIRHQMPDEIILLKCYDTAQGSDGSVLYCGHVAVKVDNDADGIAPELVRPRESIEVRLVALWE